MNFASEQVRIGKLRERSVGIGIGCGGGALVRTVPKLRERPAREGRANRNAGQVDDRGGQVAEAHGLAQHVAAMRAGR